MRQDITERLDDWINEMLDQGYTTDEVASAIELRFYAIKEENGA